MVLPFTFSENHYMNTQTLIAQQVAKAYAIALFKAYAAQRVAASQKQG